MIEYYGNINMNSMPRLNPQSGVVLSNTNKNPNLTSSAQIGPNLTNTAQIGPNLTSSAQIGPNLTNIALGNNADTSLGSVLTKTNIKNILAKSMKSNIFSYLEQKNIFLTKNSDIINNLNKIISSYTDEVNSKYISIYESINEEFNNYNKKNYSNIDSNKKNYSMAKDMIKPASIINGLFIDFIEKFEEDTNYFLNNITSNFSEKNINSNHKYTNDYVNYINKYTEYILKCYILHRIIKEILPNILIINENVTEKIQSLIDGTSSKITEMKESFTKLSAKQRENFENRISDRETVNSRLNIYMNKFISYKDTIRKIFNKLDDNFILKISMFHDSIVSNENTYTRKITEYSTKLMNGININYPERVLQQQNVIYLYLNKEITLLNESYINNDTVINFLTKNIDSVSSVAMSIFNSIKGNNKESIKKFNYLANFIPSMNIKNTIYSILNLSKRKYLEKLTNRINSQKINNNRNSINTKLNKLSRKKDILQNSYGVPGSEKYVNQQRKIMTNTATNIKKNMMYKLQRVGFILAGLRNLVNVARSGNIFPGNYPNMYFPSRNAVNEITSHDFSTVNSEKLSIKPNLTYTTNTQKFSSSYPNTKPHIKNNSADSGTSFEYSNHINVPPKSSKKLKNLYSEMSTQQIPMLKSETRSKLFDSFNSITEQNPIEYKSLQNTSIQSANSHNELEPELELKGESSKIDRSIVNMSQYEKPTNVPKNNFNPDDEVLFKFNGTNDIRIGKVKKNSSGSNNLEVEFNPNNSRINHASIKDITILGLATRKKNNNAISILTIPGSIMISPNGLKQPSSLNVGNHHESALAESKKFSLPQNSTYVKNQGYNANNERESSGNSLNPNIASTEVKSSNGYNGRNKLIPIELPDNEYYEKPINIEQYKIMLEELNSNSITASKKLEKIGLILNKIQHSSNPNKNNRNGLLSKIKMYTELFKKIPQEKETNNKLTKIMRSGLISRFNNLFKELGFNNLFKELENSFQNLNRNLGLNQQSEQNLLEHPNLEDTSLLLPKKNSNSTSIQSVNSHNELNGNHNRKKAMMNMFYKQFHENNPDIFTPKKESVNRYNNVMYHSDNESTESNYHSAHSGNYNSGNESPDENNYNNAQSGNYNIPKTHTLNMQQEALNEWNRLEEGNEVNYYSNNGSRKIGTARLNKKNSTIESNEFWNSSFENKKTKKPRKKRIFRYTPIVIKKKPTSS
jgi:hypothetical protein